MARKTKAEKVAEIPFEDIIKASGPSGIKMLRGYLKTLRYGYNRRSATFRRAGIKSPAARQIEEYQEKHKPKDISEMSRNQLVLEIVMLQDFFNAKTSTVKGIREVYKEQDKRIFGEDRRGRPARTMSQEERDRYWALYNEYINQKRGSEERFGSGQIQMFLADAIYGTVGPIDDLQRLFDRVESELMEEREAENLGQLLNLYRGGGPTFK